MNNLKKAVLLLEDGTKYQGFSFGSEKSKAGEVVFNTAMTGYTESLTDPSYKGQILVATYPMEGNYGIPGDKATDNIPDFFESDRIHVQGFVVDDYSFEYSHWNAAKSLDQSTLYPPTTTPTRTTSWRKCRARMSPHTAMARRPWYSLTAASKTISSAVSPVAV